MSKLVTLSVLAVLTLTGALPARAYEYRLSCSLQVDKSGLATVHASELQTESTTLTLRENEEVVFAELNFQDELPPGTEIEIWPAVTGEVPPWALVGENFPYARNLWITDERTGSLVRFEVTEIARAWQAGELTNLGFVVRITSEAGEASQQSGPSRLSAAKDVTLIYHVLPVRPPKGVSDEREPDQRKVPDAHDGSEGDD